MTTLLNRHTHGVYAIAPTPFTDSGAVDYTSLARLVGFYEDVGVRGITLLGQLGEAAKLTDTEARAIIASVLQRTQLPVVVGVSSPGFAGIRDLTSFSMDAGAAGVMIAPPNTLRTDAHIVGYYDAVAQVINPAPFVIQDYPLSFSVVMSETVIATIASAHEHCVMLKHEDWPGLDKISGLRRREAEATMPRLSILCGNGGLFLDYEMQRGADGAMTGYCFLELLVDVVALQRDNAPEHAHDLFDAHLPLIRYEQQPNLGLAVRKFVMARRGLLDHDVLRAPAPTLTETTRKEILHLLERLARTDPRAAIIKS